MAETRLVPVIFRGQVLPGVQGEVIRRNPGGNWELTLDHDINRTQQIKDAIRQLPGVIIISGNMIASKPGSVTGENVEYEIYDNVISLRTAGVEAARVRRAVEEAARAAGPVAAGPVAAAAAAAAPDGNPLVPVLNGATRVETIDINNRAENSIDLEEIQTGDDIIHIFVNNHNYYYRTDNINNWFRSKSDYAALALPERVPIAVNKRSPNPLPGVVIRRGIARVNPLQNVNDSLFNGGRRRKYKTYKKSKKSKKSKKRKTIKR